LSTQLAAIPTRHNGFLFRSRLEARWAVFFDALEIKFWYELEGFPLVTGWYLPDFFIPQVNLYAEVKPEIPDEKAMAKCGELCLRSGKNLLVLIGPPDFRTYPAMWVATDGLLNIAQVLLDIDYHKRRYYDQEHRLFTDPGEHFDHEGCFSPDYQEAVFASRAARFEEGGER
jgi:hypothetical protein